MDPLNPPPPNITAFEFHAVGSATLKRMFGAAGSIGPMLPSTRQYSGSAPAPLPLAGTSVALVTRPPVVGSPIAEAGIVMPGSCAQVSGVGSPAKAGAASSAPDNDAAVSTVRTWLICASPLS